jgi:predicted nuclease of predicted toxin-antitoxin system
VHSHLGGAMKVIIEKMEETLSAIKSSELRKNPKASAKDLEIKQMISELKNCINVKTQDFKDHGVLRFINPKVLLEN